MLYSVNTSWGNPLEYTEEFFDTKAEARAYCKEHNIPTTAIRNEDYCG